jgi:hypothetical protein
MIPIQVTAISSDARFELTLVSSAVGRAHGISAAQVASLNDHRTDFNFSDLERLVLEYADRRTQTPVEVPNALFARLREKFSEGAVCALPVRPAAADRST